MHRAQVHRHLMVVRPCSKSLPTVYQQCTKECRPERRAESADGELNGKRPLSLPRHSQPARGVYGLERGLEGSFRLNPMAFRLQRVALQAVAGELRMPV